MGDGGPDVTALDNYLQFLQLSGGSAKTVLEYHRTLLRLGRYLETRGSELVTATADDLYEWRQELQGMAVNTILAYASPVRGFFHWARKTGLRADDPSEDMPLPKARHGLPRPIGEKDLEMAIKLAPDRIRPWLVLAAYAGLRAAEIAGLMRDQIMDTARPPLLWISGKGSKYRTVPMSPYVWDELTISGLPRRGPAFSRCDGRPGPNRPVTISNVANRHLHGCGLDDTLHSLRHRFATRALDTCQNLRLVQELLGHSSPATTQVYTLVSVDQTVSVVNAIQPAHRLTQDVQP